MFLQHLRPPKPGLGRSGGARAVGSLRRCGLVRTASSQLFLFGGASAHFPMAGRGQDPVTAAAGGLS